MKAYLLRTCDPFMKSYGGFRWPEKGLVEAPDWNPDLKCRNGLHGWLWGEGDGRLGDWSPGARWLVVEVDAASVVDLGGKVKVPRGIVVHVGDRKSATDDIIARGATGAVIGATLTGGHGATLTGGYRATLTGGNDATLTGGDFATLIGGDGAALCGWWVDGARRRLAVAYVGEDGIKPGEPYRVDDRGRFVRVDASHEPVE